MSVTAKRLVQIEYSGDVDAVEIIDAAINTVSPGQINIVTLSSGANTISPPVGAVSCTIVPPALNAISIILKGVTGDTGIRIHNTDPTTIAIDPSVASFVLTVAMQIIGVRFFWT